MVFMALAQVLSIEGPGAATLAAWETLLPVHRFIVPDEAAFLSEAFVAASGSAAPCAPRGAPLFVTKRRECVGRGTRGNTVGWRIGC
jgi:uncharacterized membrane protein YhhN